MNIRAKSPLRKGKKRRKHDKGHAVGFYTTDDGQCFTLFKGGNRRDHPDLKNEEQPKDDILLINQVPHAEDDSPRWRQLEERHVLRYFGRPNSRIGRCGEHGFQIIVDDKPEYVRYRDLFRPETGVRNVLLAAGVNFTATHDVIVFDLSCLSQSCFHFRMQPGVPAVRIENKRLTVKRRSKNKNQWELAAENN